MRNSDRQKEKPRQTERNRKRERYSDKERVSDRIRNKAATGTESVMEMNKVRD